MSVRGTSPMQRRPSSSEWAVIGQTAGWNRGEAARPMEGRMSGKVDAITSACAGFRGMPLPLRILDGVRPEIDDGGPPYNGGIMTARGPEITDTPIAGLVELALRAPTLQRLVDLAGRRPDQSALGA